MDMVTFVECNQMDVDQGTSSSGLPMSSEDTGLGAVASPLAGYLGKVQERAASLEHCPWCTSKGLNYALHSYSINLQESVTFCTNPLCMFPLVSRSLDDVLASLVPVQPTAGNKKRTLGDGDVTNSSAKRLRSGELDAAEAQSGTEAPINLAEQCVDIEISVQDAAPGADAETFTGYNRVFDCAAAETREGELPPLQDNAEEMETDNAACTTPLVCSDLTRQSSSGALLTAEKDHPRGILRASEAEDDPRRVTGHPEVPSTQCSITSNPPSLPSDSAQCPEINGASLQPGEQRAGEETPTPHAGQDTADVKLETEDSSTTSFRGSEEPTPLPTQLFWQNTDNLCWLDSLLAALVNCRSLRESKPPVEPQRSPVWQLMRRYEDICAEVRVHQQAGKDDLAVAPDHVLQKANADLHSLRMMVFEQLQPKLQCKLGQRETPVFAMPLLLAMDLWAEPVFQSTFLWEFNCRQCSAASLEQLTKTLPTCTNLVPDWSPLNAVHLAPCNVCGRRVKQKRKMILERVPPVFVLHFVEGLPNNDVRMYSFSFEGRRYSITTVIQYHLQLKHFVTWVRRSDGSWLELDDLKHPVSKTHQNLPVPAQEMHVVFWEVEQDKESRHCSPSSTFQDSSQPKTDEVLARSPDHALLASHSDIISALSEDAAAAADVSISHTALLDTFEGLTHNDIITLTLVELNPDSETTPAEGDMQTQDTSKHEMLNMAADSASAAKLCNSHDAAPSSSSEVESAAGLLGDPAAVPKAVQCRGMRRGKAAGQQNDAPPEPSEVKSDEPEANTAQGKRPPGGSTRPKPTSPSPPASCTATSQSNSELITRMNFLINMHPINQAKMSEAKYTPTTFTPVLPAHLKPALPSHSTPNSVRKQPQPQSQSQPQPQQQHQQQIPARLFPKPQLRTEKSDSLSLKAAEMYHGFGTKDPSLLSPPACHTREPTPLPPISSHAQKTLTSAPLAPPLKTHTEVSSPKKSGRGSSKVPPGLSETEVLRFRLKRKLKAKKKKLAKLDQALRQGDGGRLQPDSTNLPSPSVVTSSTYNVPTNEDFLLDLLSPATTASNLSPDSTDFLSIFTNSPEGVSQMECAVNGVGAPPQTHAYTHTYTHETHDDNFMDEFISQAVAEGPTEMEHEALSALEFLI